MPVTMKVKRGTRAQIDAAAGSSGLQQGELYLITDENRLAVGLSATTYADLMIPGDGVQKTSATGSALLPAGTTAQRDGSPTTGAIRWNTTDEAFEGYDGTDWVPLFHGGGTVTGDLTLNGDLTVWGVTNGIYHGVLDKTYYFDSYEGSRNLNTFLKTQRSDILRYQPVGNLEYWDGSAWQDGSAQLTNLKKVLDGRADTLWNVPAQYYRFRFTVQPTSAWPLMALIGAQTFWSGSTFPGYTMTVEEQQADTSWLTLVTADFNSSNGVSNWGTAVRADKALHTGRGATPDATRITIDFYGWNPNNPSYTTIPLQNIFIFSNFEGEENQILASIMDYDRNITVPGDLIVMGDYVHGHPISDVDGLQTALDGKATTAQGALADSAVQPGDNVSTLTNDAGYLTTVAWGDVTGKPATFAPSAHTHPISEISDWPASVSTAELGYLDGVTSSIQTQLNGKLSANQTITLSGDATGSGTTAITVDIAANVIGANELNVTGNGTTSQYLRADGDGSFTWATPPDTTYSAGALLDLTGTTFDVDLSELTDMTAAMVGTDEFVVLDAGAQRRKAANEIPLSVFNNDLGGSGPDIQEFTSSGTWTKPAGVTTVWVQLWGGGGGGGAGRQGSGASSTAGGGGGGGGGAFFEQIFNADDLAATVTVNVGAGGAGGAAQTTANTDGANGSVGGQSRFGSNTCRANGGGFGSGGKTTAANGGAPGASSGSANVTIGSFSFSVVGNEYSAGATVATNSYFGGGGGATAFHGGSTINGSFPGISARSGGGGGAGGSCLSGTNGNGSAGGFGFDRVGGGGTGGSGTTVTAGGNGVFAGGAGGGGGAQGAAGGNGAVPSGGGGGGGGHDDGTSGAGGNGADGFVRVISW